MYPLARVYNLWLVRWVQYGSVMGCRTLWRSATGSGHRATRDASMYARSRCLPSFVHDRRPSAWQHTTADARHHACARVPDLHAVYAPCVSVPPLPEIFSLPPFLTPRPCDRTHLHSAVCCYGRYVRVIGTDMCSICMPVACLPACLPQYLKAICIYIALVSVYVFGVCGSTRPRRPRFGTDVSCAAHLV